MSPGPPTSAVDVDVHAVGHDHLDPADAALDVDGAAVEVLRGRRPGSGRAISSPAPKSYLSCTAAAVSGVSCRLVPSHWSAAVAPARPTAGEQAQQDQAAGAAAERADQQHHADDADGQGGVRRVGDGRAGDVDGAEHAEPERDQREREPEQDRAAAARVARAPAGCGAGSGGAVRRAGLGVRRRGVAGVARVGRRVPLLRLRGVLGRLAGAASPGRPARPAAGPRPAAVRRSLRVTKNSTTSAMIASGHGNQKTPHESPIRANAAIAPHDQQRQRCGCGRRG